MSGVKQDKGSVVRVVTAMGDWLTFSGAADREDTREIWRETLVVFLRLAWFTADNMTVVNKGQRATIRRLVDSGANLTAALPWLGDDDKARYMQDFAEIQSVFEAKDRSP